jgi:HEAT repeat protein
MTMSHSTQSFGRSVLSLALTGALLLGGGAAFAGRGSSPGAIKSAIDSGSVDAISAELERSERLVCGSCVAYVRPLVDHSDPRVRKVAAWWLARRGLRGELFVEMATRLGQPDSRKAEAAADVLGGIRHPRAVGSLGAALNNPLFDAPARVAMAAALGRIGDPAASTDLARAAGDNEPHVRAAAVAALREVTEGTGANKTTADVVDVAIVRLADPDVEVRIQAIYALGVTRGSGLAGEARDRATQGLVRVLREDAEPRARKKAVWALGEIHAPSALAGEAISGAAAKDTDASVRSLAGAALSKLAR